MYFPLVLRAKSRNQMPGYNAFCVKPILVSYYNNSINYRITNRVLLTIAFIGRLIFKQTT